MRFNPIALMSAVYLAALVTGCPLTTAWASWPPNGIPVGSTGQIQDQRAPFICADGQGGCFVAWGEQVANSSTDGDGYLQHVLADGRLDSRWPSRGLPFVVAPSAQETAAMVPDGVGGVILFWVDLRDPNQQNDLYALRVNVDGQIANGWIPNGTPIALGPVRREPRSACADGSGGAYFAWDDYTDGTTRARFAHLAANGATAAGWPSGGKLVSSDTAASALALLVSEPDGCLVTWADTRGATSLGYNMWALRFTATGDVYPGWNAAGTALLTSGTSVEARHAVADGSGGVFVGWDDNRVGITPMNPFYYDIYAQHVFGDGTRDPRWPLNGVPVCNAPDGQYDFDMGQDGSGGSVFMWEDDRANFFQVYGQRLLADGSVAPGWVPNGTQVSSSFVDKFEPRVASDGRGGFYGVWVQYVSSGSYPIVGQHMHGDGTYDQMWTSSGTLLASNQPSGFCDYPTITSDLFGGALLAYERADAAPWIRIYALRVQNDGPVPTLLSLVDYDTGPGRVTLRWQANKAADLRSTVERSTDASSWIPLGSPHLEGTDLLIYEDVGVDPGRYSYRLAYGDGPVQKFSEPVNVTVPATTELSLAGFRPNPAVSSSEIAFGLPDAAPSRLEVIDVRGRIMLSREVGQLGPGTHSVSLSAAGPLGPGVYWVRLIRSETTLVRKGLVVG
jgi:hypothetical protein